METIYCLETKYIYIYLKILMEKNKDKSKVENVRE